MRGYRKLRANALIRETAAECEAESPRLCAVWQSFRVNGKELPHPSVVRLMLKRDVQRHGYCSAAGTPLRMK